MNRFQLEHVIRAAGAIAEENDLIIIGSQAILAAVPHPPAELLYSMEVDTYPRYAPEKADLIDGSIGELSPFHEQFRYYAHGVGPETAALPIHWQDRLIPIRSENTRGVTGWCLDPGDLAVSKLLAGRPKDWAFVRAMVKHGITTPKSLASLAEEMPDNSRERLMGAVRDL